mmetsp:Transcript_53424/g.106309  ORF Transcript_53424/g.106309 Transcript_53424/m.106309 type:complete len:82 (+) Transcript_53424:437-682(+)
MRPVWNLAGTNRQWAETSTRGRWHSLFSSCIPSVRRVSYAEFVPFLSTLRLSRQQQQRQATTTRRLLACPIREERGTFSIE